MLHLGRGAARRLGASHVCSSCLTPSPFRSLQTLRLPRIPIGLGTYHNRSLSSTPRRLGEEKESSDQSTSKANESNIGNTEPPPVETSKPPKKKNKKKKKPKTTSPGPAPPSQQPNASSDDPERQLRVLQGAVEALKNVLASQNIDVGQIGRINTDIAPEASTQKHSNSNKKRKQIAKSSKGKPQLKGTEAPAEDNTAAPADPPERKAPTEPEKAGSPKSIAQSNTKRRLQKAKSRPKKSRSIIRKIVNAPDVIPSAKNAAAGAPFTGELPQPEILAMLMQSRGNKPFKSHSQPKPSKGTEMPREGATPQEEGTSKDMVISSINSKALHLDPIAMEQPPVPSLSYNLDRVLFNPGVYQLQEPRSRVYNFDPYLSQIMPVQEFDFDALKQYVTSSKDSNLISIAKKHEKKYTGSTSSMTSMLAHFHYLLSSWRPIGVDMLSKSFPVESLQYTRIMRAPAATFLHWKDGTYAIDADKQYDTANVLSMLGKSMEKLLTLSKEDYEKYRHENSDQITEEERNAAEAFHYTGFQDFMMRSQLDAYDPRMPGTGMFDLKTRAVISIRMDAKGFQKGLGYEIRRRFGEWESFEREYYDMIRSAFLKYSLQVRMGRMDGIFVAFHNTQRIFGFQYIPLSEMDQSLHGTTNTTLGDREFKLSLKLLNELMDRATARFPEKSLRMHFETRTSANAPYMYVFARPVEPGEIEKVQNAGKASVESFEREILGMAKDVAEAESEAAGETSEPLEETLDEDENLAIAEERASLTAWDEVRRMVEDAVDDDELGVGSVREAIADALEQSGLLRARSSTEARDHVDALLGALTGHGESEHTQSEDLPEAEENSPETTQDNDPIASIDAVELEDHEEVVDEAETTSEIDDTDVSRGVSSDVPATSQDPNDHSTSASEEQSESASAPKQGAPSPQPSESHNIYGASEVESISNSTKHQSTQAAHENTPVTQHAPISGVSTQGQDTTGVTDFRECTLIPNHEDRAGEDGVARLGGDEVPVAEREQSQATSTEVVEEEAANDEEEQEEEDVEDDLDDETSLEESADASNMSPLKDLIVRMAQRIDERRISQHVPEDMFDDSSKLKEFERILGKLMSESRSEESQQSSDTATLTGKPQESAAESSETPLAPESDAELESTQESSSKGSDTGASSASAKSKAAPEEEIKPGELLGMVLTIKNKVNSKYVARPNQLAKNDKWIVEYNIEELDEDRARKIYSQCKMRRRKTLRSEGDRDALWYQLFQGKLGKLTTKGRNFRAAETEKAKQRPVHVVGQGEPMSSSWKEMFGGPYDGGRIGTLRDELASSVEAESRAQDDEETEEARLANKDIQGPSNSETSSPMTVDSGKVEEGNTEGNSKDNAGVQGKKES
ncbi:Pet127-domain-containing protein [Xylariomycetidae sp. FL2044]|nr:Pet127-domain-containing protein [Xylariomycetidae sp. FL2044]